MIIGKNIGKVTKRFISLRSLIQGTKHVQSQLQNPLNDPVLVPQGQGTTMHVGTAGAFKNRRHSRLDTKVTKARVWSNKEQQGVPPKLNALQLTQLTQLPREPSSSMRRCAMLFGPSAWQRG